MEREVQAQAAGQAPTKIEKLRDPNTGEYIGPDKETYETHKAIETALKLSGRLEAGAITAQVKLVVSLPNLPTTEPNEIEITPVIVPNASTLPEQVENPGENALPAPEPGPEQGGADGV